MIAANYFDGRCGRRLPVQLEISSGKITLHALGLTKTYLTGKTVVKEPFAEAPCVLSFADGSHCEVEAAQDKAAVLEGMAFHKSLVMRWQEHWLGALAALVVMLGLLASAYVWGLPWAVDRLAPLVSVELEKKLGEQILAGLDKQVFKPSKLSEERQREAQAVFANMLPSQPRIPLRLVFRDSASFGPNAFAVPGGTIVVNDAMMQQIAGSNTPLTGGLAKEFAAVIAHEIGHQEKRHAINGLIRNSALAVLTGSLFGDFSAVASGAPLLLVQSEYSRQMETEADDYAAALLVQHGISPSHMADLFEAMEASASRNPAARMPRWMRAAGDYVACHPLTKDRVARLRLQAQGHADADQDDEDDGDDDDDDDDDDDEVSSKNAVTD
jgi:predicted Zn-dependent protease